MIMFIFASLDVAFGLRHNLVAFIDFKGDAIEEFNRTSNWLNVMKMVCYVMQTFVGDSILVQCPHSWIPFMIKSEIFSMVSALQMLDCIWQELARRLRPNGPMVGHDR